MPVQYNDKKEETKMSINEITDIPGVLVELKNISDHPGPYCMSFGFDLNPLVKSIKRSGIVNSPVLVKNSKGNLDIVTGYRRIIAVKSMGFKKLQCRILSESEFFPLRCLLLNLNDNLTTRKFNDIEKGMILFRLNKFLSKDEIIESYMPLLGLPSNERTYIDFLRIDEELDNDLKQYVAEGRMSFQSAERILDIEHGLRSYIVDLLLSLKLNINQQSQLLDYLIDIVHSKKFSLIELLNNTDFKLIYFNEKINNPQKAKAILQYFREKRFPIMVKAEKDFKEKISNLHLPQGIRINYPPFFEGTSFRMEISFKNGKQLKEKVDQLSGVRNLEDIKPPWKKEA